QALETGPQFGALAAAPLVLVDHENSLRGPTQRSGVVRQRVLSVPRFPMVDDLLRTGLSNVDHGQALPMVVLNLMRGESVNSSLENVRRWRFLDRLSRRLRCGLMLLHAPPPFREVARAVAVRRCERAFATCSRGLPGPVLATEFSAEGAVSS